MEAVAIVDSGGANIASLCYAFERLGVAARLTCDPREVRDAPRVILPGVGAAGDAMRRLASLGLAEILPTLTQPASTCTLSMVSPRRPVRAHSRPATTVSSSLP